MALSASQPHAGVGTLNEQDLHASLKAAIAAPGDRMEVAVDGYVIDIVRGSQLIEIQTRNFSSMRAKLASLVGNHPVRLVHPIAARKWIEKAASDQAPGSRRRSPKRGLVVDLFAELVSFPSLIEHPSFELEIVMVEEEEHQRFDGTRGRRRRGWVVTERRLLDIVERRIFAEPADLAGLMPEGLPSPFTTADLANALGRPRRLGQQMAYCLRELGLIEMAGRSRDGFEYHRVGG